MPKDEIPESSIAAALQAWRLLVAADAAWSLDRVFKIGEGLLELRAQATANAGVDLPAGPTYTATFKSELAAAGFDGMDPQTARQFVWCAENREDVMAVDAASTSKRAPISRHPGALQSAVNAKKRAAGKQKANAPKKLPAAFLRKRLEELPESMRVDHIFELATILKNLCTKHLPASAQDSDLVLLHLDNIRKTAKDKINPPAEKEPPVKAGELIVRGVHYKSDAEAGRSLGLSVEGIRTARKKGQSACDGLGLRGAVPVTIRGTHYSSTKEAADHLNVSEQTISEARLRGQKDLDRVGMTRKVQVGNREVEAVTARVAEGGRVSMPAVPAWARMQ